MVASHIFFSWYNHGNQGLQFTVEQKEPEGFAGLSYQGPTKEVSKRAPCVALLVLWGGGSFFYQGHIYFGQNIDARINIYILAGTLLG
jgi:hypothetical protein